MAVIAQYLSSQGRKARLLAVGLALALAAVFLGLMAGPDGFAVPDLRSAGIEAELFWRIRLPRVVVAVLVGSGLALSGALSQAVLRNPLASPFTLGIASGGAFGAALAILFGLASSWAMAGLAFVFATLTSFAILGVARLKNSRPETLILGGVAIMFLCSAATSLLQYLSDEHEMQAIVFWSFGNLGRAGWPQIAIVAAMVLAPLPLLARLSWDLNALVAGDEAAASLGVEVKRVRVVSVLLISLMAAGSICFTGVIGFIGLVAPHAARLCLGADHRYLFPASALIGAALVVTADAAARTIWAPQIIPIGIVTAFIGVPFFFWLLLRSSREYW